MILLNFCSIERSLLNRNPSSKFQSEASHLLLEGQNRKLQRHGPLKAVAVILKSSGAEKPNGEENHSEPKVAALQLHGFVHNSTLTPIITHLA